MRSTSGMKPMSSMRSASSITSSLASVSRIVPRSNMSISRPGVAISTSTPRISTSFWSDMLSPPMISAWVSFRYLPYCDEVLGDLQRQFARRLQDQAARHAGAGARAGQDVEHRQGEAGGLAGAGLRRAHARRGPSARTESPAPGSASDGDSPCRRWRAAPPRTGRDRQRWDACLPAAPRRSPGRRSSGRGRSVPPQRSWSRSKRGPIRIWRSWI